MKANVKISANNAVRGETSIDVAIQVNASSCSDAKGIIKGLVNAMLVSDCVMNNFGFRAFTREYIAEHESIDDESCYAIVVNVEGNQLLTCRRPMVRPDEKRPDDSTRLDIRMQFENDYD